MLVDGRPPDVSAGGPPGRKADLGRLARRLYRGEPVALAYGASKAGLQALTPVVGVAAAVAPGFTDTETATRVLEGPDGPAVRVQSPFGRVAAADEIDAAVVWLATQAPEWVSGSVIDLNRASYLPRDQPRRSAGVNYPVIVRLVLADSAGRSGDQAPP